MLKRLDELLPPAYRHARLWRVDRGLARRMLAARGGIYLWGPVGTGKTYAMAALARHIICTCGLACRRVTFNDLLLDVRASWRRRGGPDEWEIICNYRRADRLILEDVAAAGEERGIGLRVMLEILDWRCEHGLPTHFTSNRPPEDLEAIFDERISSRVIGSCDVLHLAGRDRRLPPTPGDTRP
jgi:DNA replication protein DnaC